jgi:hypothetical protein
MVPVGSRSPPPRAVSRRGDAGADLEGLVVCAAGASFLRSSSFACARGVAAGRSSTPPRSRRSMLLSITRSDRSGGLDHPNRRSQVHGWDVWEEMLVLARSC